MMKNPLWAYKFAKSNKSSSDSVVSVKLDGVEHLINYYITFFLSGLFVYVRTHQRCSEMRVHLSLCCIFQLYVLDLTLNFSVTCVVSGCIQQYIQYIC